MNITKNIWIILIFVFVVGLAGGIIGELVARAYLFDHSFVNPFFGSIDFNNGQYDRAQLIIRDAKKIVVEQDDKTAEIIDSVSGSLVGIFKKIEAPTTDTSFDLDNYYYSKDALGQGLVITSDGWIITALTLNPSDDYVIITAGGRVYDIKEAAKDSLSSFSLIRAEARDLPVLKFVEAVNLTKGQSVVAIDWQGQNILTTISNPGYSPDELARASDGLLMKIILARDLSPDFKGGVLFTLAGEIVGLVDGEGNVNRIDAFSAAINSTLKHNEIRRASLGVYYLRLDDLIDAEGNNPQTVGAMIYPNDKKIAVVKNSAADKAGLKNGDIIISIDGIRLTNGEDLATIISKHIAGDKIFIEYERVGEAKDAEIELGEYQKIKN